MASRQVVMVAMPCKEVVEVDGALDIFYYANHVLASARASDLSDMTPSLTRGALQQATEMV